MTLNQTLESRLIEKVKQLSREQIEQVEQFVDTRTDFLHQLSTRLIQENQLIALEYLNISGMVKNRQLSRAISDLGWRSFRTMLEAKGDMYGREVRVINR